jgi:aminoglycoside 6'-N-acetyltransferase
VTADLRLRFRPLAHADLPIVAAWLREPHVAAWWDGPETLEDVRGKYGPRIDGSHHVRCYIACDDDREIGFVQAYRIGDEPTYAPSHDLDPDAVGIDLYLGDPRYLGRGIGRRMLLAFLDEVIFVDNAVPYAMIDPDVTNERAIRTYEQAGFVRVGVLERADETVLLMRRERP